MFEASIAFHQAAPERLAFVTERGVAQIMGQRYWSPQGLHSSGGRG